MKDSLQVNNLWKAFLSPAGVRVPVLRGVSFSVAAGEAVAITGASGAGKSTLLHLVAGFEAADQGEISFGPGEPQGQSPPTCATAGSSRWTIPSASRIGFVFQFHHLLADLNALENVSLPLRIARHSRAESEQRATQCLEQLGMSRQLKQRLGELSGGEQQRVALARALVTDPAIVLADEPTGQLDREISEDIARLLVEYGRRRRAVVVIATHDEALPRLCDRILTLRDGRIEAST